MDMETWNWSKDEEVLKRYQIPREMLFEAVKPGEIIGQVTSYASEKTGFPEGLPVVSVTNDKAVEGLGSGLINEETAVISLGTYITLMIQGKKLPDNPKHFGQFYHQCPECIFMRAMAFDVGCGL